MCSRLLLNLYMFLVLRTNFRFVELWPVRYNIYHNGLFMLVFSLIVLGRHTTLVGWVFFNSLISPFTFLKEVGFNLLLALCVLRVDLLQPLIPVLADGSYHSHSNKNSTSAAKAVIQAIKSLLLPHPFFFSPAIIAVAFPSLGPFKTASSWIVFPPSLTLVFHCFTMNLGGWFFFFLVSYFTIGISNFRGPTRQRFFIPGPPTTQEQLLVFSFNLMILALSISMFSFYFLICNTFFFMFAFLVFV